MDIKRSRLSARILALGIIIYLITGLFSAKGAFAEEAFSLSDASVGNDSRTAAPSSAPFAELPKDSPASDKGIIPSFPNILSNLSHFNTPPFHSERELPAAPAQAGQEQPEGEAPYAAVVAQWNISGIGGSVMATLYSDGLLSVTGSGPVKELWKRPPPGTVITKKGYWMPYTDTITAVSIDPAVRPRSLWGWFADCPNLTTVRAGTTIPAGTVSTAAMFTACPNLTSLPAGFTLPSSVTEADHMFNNCPKLTSLPDSFAVPTGAAIENMFRVSPGPVAMDYRGTNSVVKGLPWASWNRVLATTIPFWSNYPPNTLLHNVATNANLTLNRPANPTRTGWTFGGWFIEPGCVTQWDFNRPVTNASLQLYAKWTVNTYTIAFNSNGGGGSMGSMAMAYNTPKALTGNAFSRTGYTFTGWNTAANGSGTPYGNGATVNNLTLTPNATVTLFAQWRANTYTLAFDSNFTHMAGIDPGLALGGGHPPGVAAGTGPESGIKPGSEGGLGSADPTNPGPAFTVAPATRAAAPQPDPAWVGGEMAPIPNLAFGIETILPDNAFRMGNYIFEGWATVPGLPAAERHEGKNFFSPGASLATPDPIPPDGGTLVLYAQWRAQVFGEGGSPAGHFFIPAAVVMADRDGFAMSVSDPSAPSTSPTELGVEIEENTPGLAWPKGSSYAVSVLPHTEGGGAKGSFALTDPRGDIQPFCVLGPGGAPYDPGSASAPGPLMLLSAYQSTGNPAGAEFSLQSVRRAEDFRQNSTYKATLSFRIERIG